MNAPNSSLDLQPSTLNSREGLASRAWWLASLVIPGWSQLMLGRWSGFAWLALACAIWAVFWARLFRGEWLDAGLCLFSAALVHIACTFHAARLGRRR